MKKMPFVCGAAGMLQLCACRKNLLDYRQGDLKVVVEMGEGWKHDFPLFLGINKKNDP